MTAWILDHHLDSTGEEGETDSMNPDFKVVFPVQLVWALAHCSWADQMWLEKHFGTKR